MGIIKCELDQWVEYDVKGEDPESLEGFWLRQQLAVDKSPWDGIEISMRGLHPHPEVNETGWWPIGIKWEKYDLDDVEHTRKPLMSLEDSEVQKLIDRLWILGYRPSGWDDSNAETLKAIQSQLEKIWSAMT